MTVLCPPNPLLRSVLSGFAAASDSRGSSRSLTLAARRGDGEGDLPTPGCETAGYDLLRISRELNLTALLRTVPLHYKPFRRQQPGRDLVAQGNGVGGDRASEAFGDRGVPKVFQKSSL